MRDNYNYDSIFHSYTKYRPATFNNILAYDNSIFKFKERVRGFNKIQREMEIKPSKKNMEPIEIFIKEDNKKKIYVDQSQSDHDSIESKGEEKSEKQLKKQIASQILKLPRKKKKQKLY
jgi:hypothetical protein